MSRCECSYTASREDPVHRRHREHQLDDHAASSSSAGTSCTSSTAARRRKYPLPAGARVIAHDVHGGRAPRGAARRPLRRRRRLDRLHAADIERDLAWFAGGRESASTGQFIFISSASAYQKPPSHPVITESTPLANPYWEYSRNKIACEELLMQRPPRDGLPDDHRPPVAHLRHHRAGRGRPLRLHHHRPHPARQAGDRPRRGDVALDADPRRRLRARLHRPAAATRAPSATPSTSPRTSG